MEQFIEPRYARGTILESLGNNLTFPAGVNYVVDISPQEIDEIDASLISGCTGKYEYGILELKTLNRSGNPNSPNQWWSTQSQDVVENPEYFKVVGQVDLGNKRICVGPDFVKRYPEFECFYTSGNLN